MLPPKIKEEVIPILASKLIHSVAFEDDILYFIIYIETSVVSILFILLPKTAVPKKFLKMANFLICQPLFLKVAKENSPFCNLHLMLVICDIQCGEKESYHYEKMKLSGKRFYF